MKTSLEELTVNDFVALLGGDISVLEVDFEDVSTEEVATTVRNIVIEYKEIADRSGIERYISDSDDLLKAKMTHIIFAICVSLMKMHEYDRAKSIMDMCCIDTDGMSEIKLEALATSHLEQAKKEISDLESERDAESTKTAINIRREFDAQTAALMAHYKFQIDPSTMMASVYAHLVGRYNREIQAQLATMKK